VFSSSLHLFKNIKGSLKRCISFSTSKALHDLHISFKNVFRHYAKLLRKNLP
jgi:chorismate mutase